MPSSLSFNDLSLVVTDLKLATCTKHYVLCNILKYEWNLFFTIIFVDLLWPLMTQV